MATRVEASLDPFCHMTLSIAQLWRYSIAAILQFCQLSIDFLDTQCPFHQTLFCLNQQNALQRMNG